MKRRTVFILAAALTLVVPLVTWLLHSQARPLPAYQGRNAREWLNQVFTTNQTSAIGAFREMGPATTVFLVEALDWPDNFWTRLYSDWFPKLPLAIRQRLNGPENHDTLANAASLVMLNVRDSTPEKTFPKLVRLLSANNPRTRLHAAGVVQHYSLNYSELELARWRPQLLRVLGDSNDWIRINVALTLHNSRLDSPEILKTVKRSLTNADPVIRQAATAAVSTLAPTRAASASSAR